MPTTGNMFHGSEYVIFVDIEPSYEEMSVDFVARKLETGTIHVVSALIAGIETWLPTHCYAKLDD